MVPVPGVLAVLLVTGVLVYSASCTLQERVIFPREYANQRALASPPAGVTPLWSPAADGTRVEAWFVPGRGASAERPGPAVMFFHGNGELIDHQLALAASYAARGVSVLLPEYRGYGRSQGKPSQAAIVGDMLRFHDELAARPEVDRARVVFHGRSLGGGVASALAAVRPPAALILESTFTSLAALARKHGLPEALCRHPFRTDRVLPALQRPVLILHGSEDEMIPVAHGRSLHTSAPGSTYVELPGGHNDFPRDRPAYERALDAFLRASGVLLEDRQ
ncbi:alpha/beta hydrolase [Nannocystis punicea]|uniref:Alpha/beta hydrolase n=1 Tax=Nannocystis punicea TaxID=2995304 RepID=A0ABY7HBQ0_9BACT|nr:alpha/beta hydrolase [Nannocystis poenicansa]WAS96711.1 alpha/beta hydrolase [Nannocystis poenicansa]